ncbi:MAG: hypothetical protein AVDCRST_MAG36-2500, partial [uncultured Nocardioidaceae bacterium]
ATHRAVGAARGRARQWLLPALGEHPGAGRAGRAHGVGGTGRGDERQGGVGSGSGGARPAGLRTL